VQLFPSSAQIEGRNLPLAIAAVAAGGATGATLRWAVGTFFDVEAGSWPWRTLIVNVLGCLAIGVAVHRLERGSLRWDAIVTGLLGGFTTMSSFAVELNDFVDRDLTGTAVAYGGITVASCAAAVGLASALSQQRTRTNHSRGDDT
jgi:CrcB protein